METFVHVVKLVATVFLLSLVFSLIGGWLLALLEPNDKTVLRDDERTVDLTGRRW